MSEQPTVETVPKAEFEQLKSKAEETTRTMEDLRNKLLDPEYISYLETKNKPKPALPGTTPVNLQSMTLEQLQGLIATGVATSVQDALKPINQRLGQVQIRQELDDVKARHTDFDDHKDKIVEILNGSDNELTIEQAYLLAKAQVGEATPKPKETPPAKPAQGNEKPSSRVPVEGDTIKTFKDPHAAAQAAWAEVSAKHGLSGDKI